jgi:hypothetical protein
VAGGSEETSTVQDPPVGTEEQDEDGEAEKSDALVPETEAVMALRAGAKLETVTAASAAGPGIEARTAPVGPPSFVTVSVSLSVIPGGAMSSSGAAAGSGEGAATWADGSRDSAG